jgi:toxin-antitoxin system PIN domain toxin
MILADANLLLYAYNTSAAEHKRARAWLGQSLSQSELFGLSWQTITAFIRIGTNPRAFDSPLTTKEATAAVAAWLERPMVRILSPGPGHWEIFERLLIEGQVRGPLVMDAHLAALAIEHGAVLHSTDRDFARFPGLKMANPLSYK